MVNLVNLAGDYGIHTLIEFHQDLFSHKFCGDGVPLWAIPKSTWRSFAKPLKVKVEYDNVTQHPTVASCHTHPWGDYYFTYACNKAFTNLWRNKDGLLTKFENYWKQVAQAFKGNRYVIGYELMNEPWPGDMYENPLVMVPTLSEKYNLQRAYDRIATAIRSVDPDHNICFEPVTWLNSYRSGFTHPPGGMRYSNTSILCYHYYTPPEETFEPYFKARYEDTLRLGTGGILS